MDAIHKLMNGKLISIESFDPSCIVVKPPVPSSISGVSFSEIWYLDKSGTKPVAVRPVFKTPRLPIKFGSKRFADQGAYTYCLNMSNKDIDPEIGEFYDFVKQCDRALIAAFTEKHKGWPFKPTSCLKYWTAMKRCSPTSSSSLNSVSGDFYFQLKLISASSGAGAGAGAACAQAPPSSDVATVIYNDKKVKVGPEDIVYGKYADQFIWPGYLRYDKDGIHPVWQVHQIVLSSMERVFLEHCILDHLWPTSTASLVPALTWSPGASYQHPYCAPPPPPPPPPAQAHLMMPRLMINPVELKTVIQRLRNVSTQDDSSEEY